MNVILLGPQGSGKGTQAELIKEKFHLNHFEAGKILRSIANSDNPNAKVIKSSLSSGTLVPDELVRLIAWDFINKHDRNTGFIFDGYPRSISQYEHLQDMLMRFGKKIDVVINIEISKEESIKRLSSRRTCEKCGEVYNLITNPPKDNRCKCGGNLFQREDDKPQAIERRLQIYRETTHLVFQRALSEGIGIEINGQQPIETIFKNIEDTLGKLT